MSGPSGHGSGIRFYWDHPISSLIFVQPATQTGRRAGVFSIAILGADTTLAALPATPVQLAHACRVAGYELAVPASWGDELIAAECLNQLGDRGARPAVMCACPHVRTQLLGVGPDLAPLLVPLVSPPVAVARYLHALYGRERVHLTYIGACPAGADEALDAHHTPGEFLESLAASGISLTDQPKVFDSVIPPDRRRFFSLAGGVPSAEQLWSAGNGRALVELDGEDYLIDLAQHLLSHAAALIDVAPRLGCACSGASVAIPARSARAAVAVIDPPRAFGAVVDMTVPIELVDPIPFIPASQEGEAFRGASESAVVHGTSAQMSAQVAGAPDPASARRSVAATGVARRRSPAMGIRAVQTRIPVAHVAGGLLPRAYAAVRRPIHPGVQAPRVEPGIARISPALPDAVGDDNGRSRAPARVAAAPRTAGQGGPAAAVAAGASGAPERMSDGPRA